MKVNILFLSCNLLISGCASLSQIPETISGQAVHSTEYLAAYPHKYDGKRVYIRGCLEFTGPPDFDEKHPYSARTVVRAWNAYSLISEIQDNETQPAALLRSDKNFRSRNFLVWAKSNGSKWRKAVDRNVLIEGQYTDENGNALEPWPAGMVVDSVTYNIQIKDAKLLRVAGRCTWEDDIETVVIDDDDG